MASQSPVLPSPVLIPLTYAHVHTILVRCGSEPAVAVAMNLTAAGLTGEALPVAAAERRL